MYYEWYVSYVNIVTNNLQKYIPACTYSYVRMYNDVQNLLVRVQI